MDKRGKDWHEVHLMPKNPTDDERISWHLEHAKNCACRPIPKGVIMLMNLNGIKVPK